MKEFGFGPCFGGSWVPSKIEDISRLVYKICVTFRSAASECPTHISYILKIGGGCLLHGLVSWCLLLFLLMEEILHQLVSIDK